MNQLDELVCAARDVGRAAPDQAARTRRALLASLAVRKRRGKHASVGLLLVAAVAGGSAWAASPGGRWLRGTPSKEGEPSLSGSPVAGRAQHAPAPAYSAAQSPIAATASASAPVDPRAGPSAKRRTSSSSEVDALYGQAHRAHFVEHDYVKALREWDHYLSVAPRDPRDGFVLEARYNRAICLLRLGRVEEGRAALEPFARGAYRETEARTLLDSLK